MTDKELIENHLNKYYILHISSNRDDVFDCLIGARSDIDGKHLPEKYLVREIQSTFGIHMMDDNMTIDEVIGNWLRVGVEETFKDIKESLKELEVIFGRTSWEVKKDGVDFKLETLIEKYSGKYDKSAVVAIYEDWKHEQIIEVSERILNS